MRKKYHMLLPVLFSLGLLLWGCRQREYADVRDHVVTSMENAIENTMESDGEALLPDDYPGFFHGIEITEENLPYFPCTDEGLFAIDREPELGGISIAYCTSPDPVIVVPEQIGGETVVAVNTAAFAESSYEAIVLPDTVQVVRNAAFQRCGSLRYVHFGTGLKTLEWMAFNMCPNLRRVTIPVGCRKLSGCIFYMCDRLTAIVIPDTVTEITEEFLSYSSCRNARIFTNIGSEAERVLSGSGVPVSHLSKEDMVAKEERYQAEQMTLAPEDYVDR